MATPTIVTVMAIQIDGEVLPLEPNSHLTIECAPGALTTVG